jgi:uncharacterized Zn finger protein (UPF0148 family)
MKCEFCGGILVWDYERGEVVCSHCGIVQDKLTSNDIPGYAVNEKVEHMDLRENRFEDNRIKVYSPGYRRILRLYLTASRKINGKPWLEVDYNKLFTTGKFVKTIVSSASIKARESIERYGYWELVNRGLRVLEKVNPALLARSERCKYALAYMVTKFIETGKIPSEEEIVSVFNVSGTSYRRLRTVVLNIQNQHVFMHFKNM